MRFNLIVFLFSTLSCKHMGLEFNPPDTLKAVVQGVVKGINIHCEKILRLQNVKWEVMCKVSDEIDIKYQTESIDHDQVKLNIVIDKKKGNKRKTLAAPTLLVKRNKPSRVTTISQQERLDISAEPSL